MRIRLFIFLLFSFPVAAHAWSWKDASSLTLAKNQNIQSDENQLKAAKYDVTTSKSRLYPSVTMLGLWNEFYGQHKELEHRAFIGPRWRYLVYQGGKVSSGIDVASYQATEAELQRTLTSIEINSKLRQAFAGALYAKNSIQLNQKIEAQRLENVQFTQSRYQSGLEFKWVYSSSKVKWERAKIEMEEAQLDQKSSLKDLEALTGPLPFASINEVTGDDFYADENSIEPDQILVALDRHPQVQIRKAKVDEYQARTRYSKADYYPTIALQADTSLSSIRNEDLFPYLGASVAFSMPLFEGFRIQSQTDSARAQYQQQVNDLTQAKLDLASRIQRTYQEYVLAKKRLEISKVNVTVSDDRARVVEKQYRAGLTTFLDWERSQDDWVSAQDELLNNTRAYQNTRARYEEAIGTELVAQ